MFFVRMIRLIPLVAIILAIAFVIYVVAQIKFSPNKAKVIVIKVLMWICIALIAIFALLCLYAILDANMQAFELFLSFAAVPFVGFLIVLLCRIRFYKNHPNYKYEAKKTSQSVGFVEFWQKRIKKFVIDFIMKKFK